MRSFSVSRSLSVLLRSAYRPVTRGAVSTPDSDPDLLSLAATDLVGWIGKFRYSYAAWSGNDIKFRPVSFYCAVAEQLADEGF